MTDLFDGMAAIFRDTFGRPVVYTPVATGAAMPGFTAIFTRRPIDVVLGDTPPADGEICTLDLALENVAAPAEGDLVTVPADGNSPAEGTFKVVPPIRPDGKGMVTVMLERTA